MRDALQESPRAVDRVDVPDDVAFAGGSGPAVAGEHAGGLFADDERLRRLGEEEVGDAALGLLVVDGHDVVEVRL